jgi:hypothetical protein
MSDSFKLSEVFIEKYHKVKPPFGFNGLGELVYLRTYSRIKEDGKNEQWFETVRRVVEGTFSMQKKWIEEHQLGWNKNKAQKSAQEMYERMFTMKFLPPGRGLWAMGSKIITEKAMYASLNNCAFTTTENIKEDLSKPFCFLMDMSMLGVGVGFDTKGEGKLCIEKPKHDKIKFQIPDSREGWVEATRLLIDSYFNGSNEVEFDYSLIRAEGLPIKGFGGTSSGSKPLMELHEDIKKVLNKNIDKNITARTIVDIMNLIGKCVVSGNVRRSAEIVFGDPNSEEYLDLKDYKKNPDRESFGWASNNSIFANLGMDYSNSAKRTSINGEPGYIWMENVQGYSRMNNGKDNKDHRAVGANPCQPACATVLTKDGIRTFADIKDGDEIWSKTGWTKVIKKWSTGIKKVYKYSTSSGYFLGTENHKIVSNGEKVEVKDAESIDTIVGPFTSEHKINPQDVIDGLVLGDGGVHKASNNLVVLYIGENDSDYFKSEISSLITEKRDGVSPYAWEVKTTILPEELPPTYNRVIPKRFLYGNSDTVCGFLRGLYSANGSFTGNRVTFKTTSPNIREQVQLMLSSLGIRSYHTTNKERQVTFSNGDYTCKESYDVNITRDCDLFYKIIGFIQEYKMEKVYNCINSKKPYSRKDKSYEIKNIELFSEEEVFDITVDNVSHTYWTASCDVSNCNEQSLENYELCCLVETFPDRHESLEDYLVTLKYAYLYAKTVTLGKTHWAETNRVLLRNRRIGCSMSGIAQFISKHGLHTLKKWCEEGYQKIEYYDEIYSDWLAIPKSIKKTSIKPSGTVSILAGATPGMHYPENEFYIRRVRLGKNSDLIEPLEKAGYKVEPCFGSEDTTSVVEIPVHVGKGIRTVSQISMWEQLSLAAFLQKNWSDNQVSATITFKPEEAEQIPYALNYFQYQLKGISFLPLQTSKNSSYKQLPYETIDEKKYNELISKIKPIKFGKIEGEEAEVDKFCNTDTCLLK